MNRWAVAWRNVSRNRRRSLLTGGIIAFGFASIALAGGFMAQSFQGLRESTIRSGLGHLQFADPREFSRNEDTTLEYGLKNADMLAALIARDSAVKVVMPRIDFFGLVSAGARSIPFMGIGVDPDAETIGSDIPATISQGHWLKPGQQTVVLGSGLARSLDAKVGDSITLLATTADGTLNAVDATVAGIANVRIKDLNDRYLATTISLAQQLLNVSGVVSRISVLLHEPARVRATGSRLLKTLRATGANIAFKRWDELATFYHQVRMLYIGIFGFMGTVLTVIVFLATANTTWMTVTERTREIGTLRAMGARSRRIIDNFIIEAILLALAGSLGGTVISLAISAALNASGIVLPPPPGSTRGFPIHVEFFPLSYLAAGGTMMVTIAVASFFPARRAARAAIVESLAHV
ncbi:MAG: ABC transporter permease [Acidiferrobacterales bacterium]